MLHILVNIDLVLNIILYPLEIKFSYKVFVLVDLRLRPKITFLFSDFVYNDFLTIICTASILMAFAMKVSWSLKMR